MNPYLDDAARTTRAADTKTADTQAELATSADLPNRSLEMQLLHEHLARAHCQHVASEAQRTVRARRLVAAARAQRRAEQASLRARRLLVLAIVR